MAPKLKLILTLGCLSSAGLFFSGCDNTQPTAYKIPKEERKVTMPMPGAGQQPSAAPTGMNELPGMKQAADAAGTVSYQVPEGWVELPASGIRKANLRIEDDNGSAELTVTVFPGDVGGRLANINCWRGQIGLDEVTADDLPEMIESYTISKHRGLYIELEGADSAILGGLLPFHGNTWFFKLLGDRATVLDAKTNFKVFLDSVSLPDAHH